MIWRGLAHVLIPRGHPQEHKQPRRFFGIKREVFGASHQRTLHHIILGRPTQAWQHFFGERRVVDGGVVLLDDRYFGLRAAALGNFFYGLAHIRMQLLANAVVVGANGAAHVHRLGDDVVAGATVDGADAHHRGK